jgi:hypothetical protein
MFDKKNPLEDTRACRQLSQMIAAARWMAARKFCAVFVVTGGDRPELLEFTEEVFDQVALFVELAVEVARCETV